MSHTVGKLSSKLKAAPQAALAAEFNRQPSLSVLLSVRNVQNALPALITDLLEVLHDLTPRWDAVIVDEGSRDATAEVAHDLTVHYPQLRYLSRPTAMVSSSVWRIGLNDTQGELLLYRPADSRHDLHDLHKLWRQSRDCDVVLSRSAAGAPLGRIPRLPGVNAGWRGEEPGLQLIRRRMLDAWRSARCGESVLTYMIEKHFPMIEVEVRDIPREGAAPQPTQRVDPVITQAMGALHRPNFMSKIRDFALGE